MKRWIVSIFIFSLVFCVHVVQAQLEEQTDSLPDNVLLEKQWTLGIQFNTNGWGFKFRDGKNITALRQMLFEIEFSTYKSQKEVRTVNPYFSDSKSYVYGKLNYVYFLRGGVGFQHILNRKPYWGGIQLSAFYYGGLSVGITKPVYLYIIHLVSTTDYEVIQERYNPETDFVDNIYGRAPFLTGILNLQFFPGLYGKGGLEFEFGTKNRAIKALEAGVNLDFSPIPIAIMAYNPKQHFFLVLYLSFSMGKRHN